MFNLRFDGVRAGTLGARSSLKAIAHICSVLMHHELKRGTWTEAKEKKLIAIVEMEIK